MAGAGIGPAASGSAAVSGTPAGAPPGMTPGRIGRDPSAERLDHMPPILSDDESAEVCVDVNTASA
ncbi:MAG: hypothetical protein ACO3S5_10730, partial [Ilumatobacteraceae bacterium]